MSFFQSLSVKIFADGADRAGMIEMAAKPHIAGLTTNPTLLAVAAGLSCIEIRADQMPAGKPWLRAELTESNGSAARSG